MSFVKQNEIRNCLKPCSEALTNAGLCHCHNRITEAAMLQNPCNTMGGSKSPNPNKMEERINHLKGTLSAIRSCTQPIDGHTDPLSINDCWNEVDDTIVEITELINVLKESYGRN